MSMLLKKFDWKKLLSRLRNVVKNNALLRRISKNLSIGVAGSGILLILSLGNTALLTKNLSMEDYGRILVVLNFYGLMAMFFGLRVNDFIYRFFPQFKVHQEYAELKGILFIAFSISLVVGLIIGFGTYFSAPWIAKIFYNDTTYVPLFRIYAVAAFFIAFDGFFISILRIHDKFAMIVVPQVIGSAISLLLIAGYLSFNESLTIEYAVWMRSAGVLVTKLPALFFSVLYIWPLIKKTEGFGLNALKMHKKQIVYNLLQTNLTGYLKLGSDTGGMFLMGLMASPAQVALYGIASQLAKVLQIMQNNIQNALTPEIVSLWAKKKIHQLYKLVNTYAKWALIGGAPISFVSILLAKPVILIFTTTEYLEALPVFYIFIITIYMTFVSLPFFPIALVMDKLSRRNLVVSLRIVYLLIAVYIGLSAITLALVQLAGSLSVRIFNDMLLMKDLKRVNKKGSL